MLDSMTKIQQLKNGHVFNGGRHKLAYNEDTKEFVITGKNAKDQPYERRFANGHIAVTTFNTVSRSI